MAWLVSLTTAHMNIKQNTSYLVYTSRKGATVRAASLVLERLHLMHLTEGPQLCQLHARS